jgi:hypothetical protein
MFVCSIHPNTRDEWIASMQDSLAKILVSLENRPDLEKALGQGFTEKSCESLAWYDQDSCSWKTYQQSFLTGWELYSETWPRWGMTRTIAVLERQMWERPMAEIDGFLKQKGFDCVYTDKRKPIAVLRILQCENGSSKIQWEWSFRGFYEIYESEILQSSVLQQSQTERVGHKESIPLEGEKTPRKLLRSMFEYKESPGASHQQGCDEQRPTELDDSLRELSQHLALEGEEGEWNLYIDVKAYAHPMSALRMGAIDGLPLQQCLESTVIMWATPNTMDSLPPKSPKALQREMEITRPGRAKPANLRDQVSNMQNWPTPSATDYKGSGKTGTLRDRLDYAVERGGTKSKEFFWTPTAGGGTKGRSEEYRKGKTPNPAEIAAALGGKLNPKWVAWLMGCPIEWVCLKG